MIKADKYLKETLQTILDNGCLDNNVRAHYKDGTPAITKFITQVFFQYDLSKNEFPVPTIRPTSVKTGLNEILWIYQKQSNSLEVAKELNINWWDAWDIGDDTIGERYGKTVANYKIIDSVLNDLRYSKFSRRHIIDLYQYNDFKASKGLHPCAFLSMFATREVNGVNSLDLMLVSRSSDFITAGFINQAQYVELLMMIVGDLNVTTKETWVVGKFSFVINNAHIYLRHLKAVEELLAREPLDFQPTITLLENKPFYDYTVKDFSFSLPKIEPLQEKLELAI